MQAQPAECTIKFSRPTDRTLLVAFSGNCTLSNKLPSLVDAQKEIESGPPIQQVSLAAEDLTDWDSGLLTFLINLHKYCSQTNIEMDLTGLPQGVRRLLELAFAVPEKKDAKKSAVREPILTRIGVGAINVAGSAKEMMSFIGDATLSLFRMMQGKARFRRVDFVNIIQDCGAQALPIVSLISFLVGLILAFVGAVQLRLFGAQIYVADLVGIAMAREMGAMMTGIIMAGRTGAAFAAQLGTMQVNEEIDALATLGIPPMDFLVLPRMIALVLMMPLLCVYADLLGIIGGLVVGVGMLDITPVQYFNQTKSALDLTNFGIGIFKSVIYGIIIALAGCLRGMQSGRSASAVGMAATSAVVTAIVAIIVADGIFAVLCNALGI